VNEQRHAAALHVPAAATPGAPHVRDATDLRRLFRRGVVAMIPCALVGVYNAGRQANRLSLGAAGVDETATRLAADVVQGLLLFVPVCAVAFATGILWERVFAARRGHRSPGLGLAVLPFTLALPPTIALWQVAAGVSFGIVVAKEIFGGTGKHFLHPGLVALAFLYFAYPDAMRGETVWVAADGAHPSRPLELAASGGIDAVWAACIPWSATLLGDVPGAFGETSALACLLGAALLLHARMASWRVLAGAVLGLVGAALVVDRLAPAAIPFAGVPWYWHLTLGSFAFGVVFFATDPVTAAVTNPGRWIYGLLIGGLTVLIRVANPVHAEGAMLAVLLGSVCAPLIDHAVVAANVRRRRRRGGRRGP
jgi:Na+-transporting NADH:ubiquinone oxidoreductase subunit B